MAKQNILKTMSQVGPNSFDNAANLNFKKTLKKL